MGVQEVLILWVASSLVLTLMWVGYRRFLGRYSVDDFDAEGSPTPRERTESTRT